MSKQLLKHPTTKKLMEIYDLFFSLEGSLFRYSLAYSLLLALLPLLIILVILFQNSILFNLDSFIDYLYRFLPEEALGTFITYITNKSFPTGIPLLISLTMSFILASRCTYSFMLVSAKHEEFTISKLYIRLKGFILFIGLIATTLGLGIFFTIIPIASNIRILSVSGSLFVVFFLFYRTITFEKRPIHYGVLGASFTTIALMITSFVFLALIRNFSSYASVYGPMASLVITLLSLYIIASIVYFGYCLNFVFTPSSTKEYKDHPLYNKVVEWLSTLKQK